MQRTPGVWVERRLTAYSVEKLEFTVATTSPASEHVASERQRARP
jgi:hypothetical protein